MKILSCNSNRPLAEAIAAYLDSPLTIADVRRFADMEVFVEIGENVRGEDVFVVQSTCFPANDNVMELLVALDALRRGSARRITAVIPYYGYARQDRKSGPRTPISAKLLANLITSAGADRVHRQPLLVLYQQQDQAHRGTQTHYADQFCETEQCLRSGDQNCS